MIRSVYGLSLVVRFVAVAAAASAVEATLLLAANDACARLSALSEGSGSDFAPALADVAVLAALLAWSWLLVSGLVAVAAALNAIGTGTASAAMGRAMPIAARHLLLWLLGLGALTASAGMVNADPPNGSSRAEVVGHWDDPHPSGARVLEGLPLPDRPSGVASRPGDRHQEQPTVVVRVGDTLWGIVARFLGPAASTAQVATTWPDWFAANRAAIGDDPDLIFPGTKLRPPAESAISRASP